MRRRSMTPGHGAGIVAAAALGAVALLVPAGAVIAEAPFRLEQQITDKVGALGSQEAQVAAALADLQANQGIQLWVAYVDGFNGAPGQEWAAATSTSSGLGGNDMLFSVATGERSYGWDVPDDLPVSDAEIAQIMGRQVEPELAAGDWAGAAIALATGLSNAGATAGSSSSSGSGGGSVLPWLLGLALLAGVGFLVLRGMRGRGAGSGGRGSGPDAGADGGQPGQQTIEELRRAAASALIEVDDSIKTSEQELGFAIAGFGEQEAVPFTAALAESKRELASAFQSQRLAQETQGTPAERAHLEQIVALCTAADDRLDDQVAQFDTLRDLERRIADVLPALNEQVTGLRTRLTASTATAEAIKAKWPPAAMGNLLNNLDQAVERITFAEESVATGTQLLTTEDRVGAVARARAAEESIGQATTLLDNVDRAPENLALAQRSIQALIVESEKDLAEAVRLGLPPEVSSRHAFASETLAWAQGAIAAGNYDPIGTRLALEESDAALETALVPLREAAESRRRAEALLATTSDAARASIQAAGDFITTRRGAVGAEARTRLADAQRRYEAGVAASDPVEALGHMQAAHQLADRASALAQQDEARYQNSQQMGGGSSGGGLGNVILGGILINAMNRGGGGRGGGISFPTGGGGGAPARRPGPGSFGGGATRGRRSGGGRF